MTSSTARVHACVKYICKSKFTFKSWNIVVDKSIMMIFPQKDTSNLVFRKIWFAIQIHSNWALVSPGSHTPERLFRCWSSQELASFPGRVVKASRGHLRLSTAEGDATPANAGLSAVLSSCSWATRHHSRWVVEAARSRTQVVAEGKVFFAPHAPISWDAVPSSRSFVERWQLAGMCWARAWSGAVATSRRFVNYDPKGRRSAVAGSHTYNCSACLSGEVFVRSIGQPRRKHLFLVLGRQPRSSRAAVGMPKDVSSNRIRPVSVRPRCRDARLQLRI